MRPRTGTTDTPANPRPDLERQITVDARSRPDVNRVLRTQCTVIRGGGGRYSCTAVTSELPGGEVSREGAIGFPYRAIANGRELTWCRIAGQPGRGLEQGQAAGCDPRPLRRLAQSPLVPAIVHAMKTPWNGSRAHSSH